MSNPFEVHGVKYISPSAINKFMKNPAKWLVNIAGYSDRIIKPAFTYGNAIETGITRAVVDNVSTKESVDLANEEFARVADLAREEGIDYDFDGAHKKQQYLKRTLEAVIPVYKDLGVPIASQKQVTYQFDSLPVTLYGILDLEYEDCVRDLKTTSYKPKKNSDYDRQLTMYSLSTDKAPVIDYVYTTTKVSELISFDVADIDIHKAQLERIVTKMMKMLSLSDDIREVCQLSNLEPNLSNDNWYEYWGANEIKGAMKLFY